MVTPDSPKRGYSLTGKFIGWAPSWVVVPTLPCPSFPQDPTYGLRLAKEQAQRQEQLLQSQEEELQALQEQLVR